MQAVWPELLNDLVKFKDIYQDKNYPITGVNWNLALTYMTHIYHTIFQFGERFLDGTLCEKTCKTDRCNKPVGFFTEPDGGSDSEPMTLFTTFLMVILVLIFN